MPPDKTHAIEELVQIELKGLGCSQIRSVKIYVVSKVGERGHRCVIGVGHSLRRIMADQVIIEQHVPVRTSSANAKLGRRSGERRRLNSLIHGPGDLRTAGITVDKLWRPLSRSRPSATLLEVRECIPHSDGHGARGGAAAGIPLFNHSM